MTDIAWMDRYWKEVLKVSTWKHDIIGSVSLRYSHWNEAAKILPLKFSSPFQFFCRLFGIALALHLNYLTKKCSIWAQKWELDQLITIIGANVEWLALGLHISIVASFNPTLTRKTWFRNFGKNRVILPGSARDGHGQHVDVCGIVRDGGSVWIDGQEIRACLIRWELPVARW